MLKPVSNAGRRSVVKRNFEKNGLNNDHKDRLSKEGEAVVRSKPVEDSATEVLVRMIASLGDSKLVLDDRTGEHDTRNVEREAITRLGPVYGDNLVRIGGYWR